MAAAGPRTLLLALAEAREVDLGPGSEADLGELLGSGLVKAVAPPRQDAQERAYEELQARHRLLLEARATAHRLALRCAPRSGLGRWLPRAGPRPPGPEDPDLLDLFTRLRELPLVVREVASPADLPGRLKAVQDHLQVEDRECLDRMADLDRRMAAERQADADGVRVEPFGWVRLTAAGARELPEWGALQDLEAAFNLVSGPRRQKIDDYSLFRHDPAGLLAFLLENPSGRENLAGSVAAFEDLAEPVGRQLSALGLRTTRMRNAFLVRTLRRHREDPRAAFAWAGRERLRALEESGRSFLPESLTGEGWNLLYGYDALEAGPAEADAGLRRRILDAALAALAAAFPGLEARDGHGVRLAVAMLHAALGRRVTAPVLVERFLQVLVRAVREGLAAAPQDLPDEGTRLVFAFHLASLAEAVPGRVAEVADRYARLEAALGGGGRGRSVPVQVVLHGLLALERLERRDAVLDAGTWAGTFRRVRRRLRTHRDLGRALHTEHSRAEDETFLAANLTALAHFAALPPPPPGRPLPDAGAAAAYEAPGHWGPPLVGLPFGTLMLP